MPVHRALFAHLTVGRIRVGVDPRMHWVETGLSHQDHVRRLQAGFIDSAGRPGIDSGLVSSRIGVPAWSPDSGTASAALNVMVESIRRDPEIPRRAFKAVSRSSRVLRWHCVGRAASLVPVQQQRM